MNKNLLIYCFGFILIFCMAINSTAYAQWCVPNSIIPYNAAMPGITHVVIGSIDRTSADLENYPYNSYVNTGLSTDLILGNTYTISITHTIDASICPDMNIRVWVDYNLDYSFDDVGETVVSTDHHLPGTYTGTFTIPITAATGTTRMRVTAKMSNTGGHTLPTPCDFPADPFGYHGEMEDYMVNIISATHVNGISNENANLNIFPSMISDHATISFCLAPNTPALIQLFTFTGESLWTKNTRTSVSGKQEIELGKEVLDNISPGIYFIQLTTENKKEIKRMVIR
ncbi:MAG: GEVED domain-containing protein [Bacteroidota bacterium]